MQESFLEERWREVSFVGACCLNANPFLRHPVKPEDINPFERTRKKRVFTPMEDILQRMEKDGYFHQR